MTDYGPIIADLEAATEPSRELDAKVDVTLLGGETVWLQANYTMEAYPASRRPSKYHVGGMANEAVPRYTASLDAVIHLAGQVLPGWNHFHDSGEGSAGVYEGPPAAGAFVFHSDHEMLPIALLIATFKALRALEAQGSE